MVGQSVWEGHSRGSGGELVREGHLCGIGGGSVLEGHLWEWWVGQYGRDTCWSGGWVAMGGTLVW